jgi:hypothetical protein
MHRLRPGAIALTLIALAVGHTLPGYALPPAEEVPEEVLRTRVITEARSAIDGRPLSAAEYAQLQAQLQDRNDAQYVDPDLAQLIFFLQLRRVVKPILPFIP